MRRIRVALLATTVDFGGIERVLLTLLGGMAADVELVPILFTRTDTREKTFFERLNTLGIAYTTMYLNTSRAKYLNPLRNLRETLALFNGESFDLVHSHGYRADLIALVIARRFGLPVVSTCHGFIGTDRHLSFYNRLNVFLLRRFTRVMAVSARMKEDLVSGGVAASRIDMVTNAVAGPAATDREASRERIRTRLGIGAGDMVFGYVGRLSEEKGVSYLIDAARAVVGAHPTCRLLIVGAGPQEAALQQRVRGTPLEAAVSFAGFQSDPSAWYSAMDAFVLPSLTEGTPMALLEAMAHGLPAIATEVGGVPAIIANGTNGLLVPPGDATRLAGAMATVARDSLLRERLADGATRSVREGYDVRSWTHRVRDVYLSAIADNGDRRRRIS
jgi:glycosyltransferase involved in cell wall biosynthesis